MKIPPFPARLPVNGTGIDVSVSSRRKVRQFNFLLPGNFAQAEIGIDDFFRIPSLRSVELALSAFFKE